MPKRPTPLILFAMAVVLAGCAERPEPAPVVYRGTTPAARPAIPRTAPVVPQTAPTASEPDANGVVDYGGYSAIVARPGDTVASMAGRVGLSASALASYNGLPSGYAPRPGDELILPPAPTGPATVESAVLAPLGAPIDDPSVTDPAAPTAAIGDAPDPAAQPAPSAPTGFDLSQIEAAIGDTPAAPTPRRDPPVIASAPPAPVASPSAPPIVATAPATQAAESAAPTAAPPSAAPASPAVATALAPATTPTATATARFVAPVNGSIIRPFSRDAGARSDGVDFAAPQGAAVVAAAPGQVALVSESLGGLGTIVLIRHENDLLTVYGRVDGVTVKKGDRVQQGQTIGAVAPGASGRDPSLHFEVRQGAESVDPERYLPG